MARKEPGGDSLERSEAFARAGARKLREAEKVLAEGVEVADVCRHLEVSIQTCKGWRAQYKAMRPANVVRLEQPERGNARLKRIVGDQALDIDMVREVARGTSRPGSAAQSCESSTGPVPGV
jgi:putative transposase